MYLDSITEMYISRVYLIRKFTYGMPDICTLVSGLGVFLVNINIAEFFSTPLILIAVHLHKNVIIRCGNVVDSWRSCLALLLAMSFAARVLILSQKVHK